MEQSIIDILYQRAHSCPNKIAYRFIDEKKIENITYFELLRKAIVISNHIVDSTKEGDRILLIYKPGLDYIIAFYASLIANRIAVPMYPPANADLIDKVQHVITDASPSLVLTSNSIKQKIGKLKLLKMVEKKISFTKNIINHIVKKNSTQLDWDFDKLKWLATDSLDYSHQTDIDSIIQQKRYEIAFIQYTSGSTNAPKGVVVTHKNIINNQNLIKEGFNHSDNDIIANWLPPYHDMGLIGAIMQPLFIGTEGILMSPFMFIKRPVSWFEMITNYRVTTSGGPNFAYAFAYDRISDAELEGIDLSNWQRAFCGAEPICKKTLEKFADRFTLCGFQRKSLFPCYGLAEATLMVSCGHYNDGAHKKIDGKDYIDTGDVYQNVIIVNPETQNKLPEGEVGEILISGDSITSGYWQNKKASQDSFNVKVNGHTQLFLRTGDLGFIQSGHLYPSGRIKDLIIINGKNYFAADIEFVTRDSSSHIKKGEVVAFPIEVDGIEKLVIIAQLRSKLDKSLCQEVMENIYGAVLKQYSLEPYEIILTIEKFINKTTSGKIQRFKTKEKFLNNEIKAYETFRNHELSLTHKEEDIDNQQPESKTDRRNTIKKIKKAISPLLGEIPDSGLDRPLTEYGLTSIKAIELTANLEKEFTRAIEPDIFYNYPSVIKLADFFRKNEGINKRAVLNPRQDSNDTEIAVIGISCMFPGDINSPEDLYDFLMDKKDAISDVPKERWDNKKYYSSKNEPGKIASTKGGFLKDIGNFDADFFNIIEKEAKYIDPQQRLTLQKVFHAFEDAGVPPSSLRETNVGVFIGAANNDYSNLILSKADDKISSYLGTGNSLSALSGRIAYQFGFKGPCLTIDTACSSSLVAIHQAIKSLKNNECPIAIAGGVNIILDPRISIALSQAGMLAPDGKCKSFSNDANGYVRSEGLGFVILKPFNQAFRDHNKIYAVIKGSAINQDGTSNGLTAPNALSQESLIRKSLEDANLSADDIDYIESHGTGTKLGDPIEISAIKSVFSTSRSVHKPLIVGAVKSNLGHLEAAAGIAGFIKTVMVLHKHKAPPNIHFNEMNHHINCNGLPIIFPTQDIPLQQEKDRNYAGVSSFGFTGTNAHIVLSSYKPSYLHHHNTLSPHPSIFLLSAQDIESLEMKKKSYAEWLKSSDIDIPALCASLATKSEHMNYRFSIQASNKNEIIQKLENTGNIVNINNQKQSKIAMLFPGQGSQYPGMARELYNSCESFKKYILLCDSAITKINGNSKLKFYFDNNNDHPDHQMNPQLLMFCIEYSLAMMWKDWGITPDYVAGHSLGTYAASCFCGIVELEDIIKLISLRSELMEQIDVKGKMLAVMAPANTVNQLIISHQFTKIDIAAYNTEHQTVVSGNNIQIQELQEICKKRDISTQLLPSKQAYHSQCMESILQKFHKTASSIEYKQSIIPIVNDLNGEITHKLDAKFYTDHIRRPINFINVSKTLEKSHCSLFIEAGPQPTLSNFILRNCSIDIDVLPSLRKGKNDLIQVNHVLKEFYLKGYKINWKMVFQNWKFNLYNQPLYPFIKRSYWFDDELKDNNPSNSQINTHVVGTAANQQTTTISLLEREDIDLADYMRELIEKELRYTANISNKKSIGLNDSFFEMGIDSLLIVQIINSINNHIKKDNLLIKPERIKTPCINGVIEAVNEQIHELKRQG